MLVSRRDEVERALETKMAEVLSRLSVAKTELVYRAFSAMTDKLLHSIFLAWRTETAAAKREGHMRSDLEAQLEASEAKARHLEEELTAVLLRQAASSDSVKMRMAERLGDIRGEKRWLGLILAAWRQRAAIDAAIQRGVVRGLRSAKSGLGGDALPDAAPRYGVRR